MKAEKYKSLSHNGIFQSPSERLILLYSHELQRYINCFKAKIYTLEDVSLVSEKVSTFEATVQSLIHTPPKVGVKKLFYNNLKHLESIFTDFLLNEYVDYKDCIEDDSIRNEEIKVERKATRNFENSSRDLLLEWYKVNFEHPYPTKEQKEELAGLTGLTRTQIDTWFVNTRRRDPKRMKNKVRVVY
jgi:hypothetical protein